MFPSECGGNTPRSSPPQWFAAVQAAVPFIAMLRKSVLMPKTAMTITIAASILGQTIGSRAERLRLKAVAAAEVGGSRVVKTRPVICGEKTGACGTEAVWDPLSVKVEGVGSAAAASPRRRLYAIDRVVFCGTVAFNNYISGMGIDRLLFDGHVYKIMDCNWAIKVPLRWQGARPR
ncbi:unnamed protein product [Musa textilis]